MCRQENKTVDNSGKTNVLKRYRKTLLINKLIFIIKFGMLYCNMRNF